MHKHNSQGYNKPAALRDTRDTDLSSPGYPAGPILLVDGKVVAAGQVTPVWFRAKAVNAVPKCRAITLTGGGVEGLASASDTRPTVAITANDAAQNETVVCMVCGVIKDAGLAPDTTYTLAPGGLLEVGGAGTVVGFTDAAGDLFCLMGGAGGGGGGTGGGGITVVANDTSRDNIPAPDAGMAVITLHDAALNVYDGVISRWRKIWEYPLERFRTVEADTTAIHGELVVCTAPVTVQLETKAGARITVKHAIARTIGPDQPTVILRPTSGLIDGSELSVLEVSMQAATVVCDGTNWYHI